MHDTAPDAAGLTAPMRLARHLRDDIRAKLQLVGLTGETDFLLWWLTSAWKEFPAAAGYPRPEDLALANAVASPAAGPEDAPLTRLMDFIWRFRNDDTAAFDRDDPAGRAAFTAWFYTSAVPEMGLFGLLDARQQAWLFEPVSAPLPALGLALPRLARLTWAARPDVRPAFDPATPEGALGLLAWYVLHGAAEMGHDGPLAWTPPLPLDADMPDLPGITRLAFLAWFSDEAARAAFDPGRPDQRPALMAWAGGRSPAAPRPSQARPPATAVCRASAPPRHPFGVNIIGFARGELGIGEDSRMCALALAAAGVPFSVVNVQTGPGTRQADGWLDACISDELPYPVNIFCLTGLDTTRLWLERGEELFSGRINIGYWPWELPGWPEVMADAYRLMDELWLSTAYAREAFAATSPVPTRLMPMAVAVDRLTPTPRARFGLPEDRFLFLYVFDANSYLARKNPLAAVAAFREAFPGGHEPVGLVLKTMNPRTDDPRWRAVAAAAAADRRIAILADTLDRGEALGLFAACDAYLSPHRAEGFGRTLAEAMLLGKPVIATGYSGNADFLTPETGFPVAYRLVPVGPGEYPFGQGMLWAEPDRAELVRALRLVLANPGLARKRGQAGRELITSRHAPATVGAAYLARLRQLA
ncbi:Glycosyltransferase [Desulfovibrio sp. DV]|uniref:glycosyltransferase family 4 protein n=1 Tax=Desulfovibrio sp. DV TaxID=1844708 RepID=UPI00094B9716|nr:glycosyltransferase family 4 protein [Desulfovibrio sp. DV]OLN24368.1 Glycosyltransferase [Desulfovibrio sp. DV]